MHKPLLAAAFAASLMGFGTFAQAQYSAIVSSAPPAARYEAAPAAREGFVWAPGHWEWRGNEYVWQEGHWMRDRAGYEYREPRWVQRADRSWYLGRQQLGAPPGRTPGAAVRAQPPGVGL